MTPSNSLPNIRSTAILVRTAGGVALCWAIAQPALAQQPPADSWARDTVVVTGEAAAVAATDAATATRTSTPLEEVPQSVQVLTRTLLEEQDQQTISSALTNVSNVTPSSTMQTVLISPLIRGFAVNYYFDGMPTYQLPATIADPATLVNVERIEVAKGPTSTLYGGGSGAPLSGLLNIVSRDPVQNFEGSISVRGGSFNTLGASGNINTPLGDTVAFRLAGMYETADSYLDVIDSERYAIFPTLGWDITDATRLIVRGRYNKLEQQEYAGIPVDLIEPNELVPREIFAGAADAPRTEIENTSLSATLTHAFSDALKAEATLSRYEGSFEERSTFPYGQIAGTIYNFGSAYLPSDTEKTYATASLVATLGDAGLRHTLLVGADYDATDYFGAMYFNTSWATIDYASPNPRAPFGSDPPFFFDQNDRLRTAAVFVQDQLSFGENLDVTAGLRYTRLSIRSAVSGVTTDQTEHRVTPRLGATYKVIDGLSLFAGYAEGFQGVVAGGFYATTPVPETSQSYEAGVKFAAPIPGLTGTLAAYRITRQNVLTPDPLIPFAYTQTGEQKSEGFEADVIYEPSPAFSILFNYAFGDATVSKDNALPVGDRLRAVPEHSGRLAARYRFIGGALNGLEIGGGATAVSNRELTLPNTLSVDGAVLVDLQASYDLGVAVISASVVNAFDDDALEPYQYFGGPYVVPTQPRSLFVTLRKDF